MSVNKPTPTIALHEMKHLKKASRKLQDEVFNEMAICSNEKREYNKPEIFTDKYADAELEKELNDLSERIAKGLEGI